MILRVLPLEKKLSALEEAEFEDDGGEEGALDREMLSQGMDDDLLLSLLDSFSFFKLLCACVFSIMDGYA